MSYLFDDHPANRSPVPSHPPPDARTQRPHHAVAYQNHPPPLPRRHPNAHNPVLAALCHLEQAYAILDEQAKRLYGRDFIPHAAKNEAGLNVWKLCVIKDCSFSRCSVGIFARQSSMAARNSTKVA